MFSYNTGNVTVFAGNNTVFGTNTTFLLDLQHGFEFYVANSFTGTDELEYLGDVDVVSSNYLIYLDRPSYHSGNGLNYTAVKPTFTVHNPRHAQPATSSVSKGFNNILTGMFDAVNSGVFNNQQQVHSYHPVIPDPKTGIPVNLPAAVLEKTSGANASVDTSKLQYGASTAQGVVKEHDVATGKLNTSLNYVYDSLLNTDVIKSATDNHNNDQIYQQAIADTKIPTPSDRYASQANISINRPTDNIQSAKQYFDTSNPILSLNSQQKQNSTQTDDVSARTIPDKQKILATSGVPIHIPGSLNAVNKIVAPTANNYVPPSFTVAQMIKNV